MPPYKPPVHGERSFNCPHCEAYAGMHWSPLTYQLLGGGNRQMVNLELTMCPYCSKYALWVQGRMVYPDQVTVPSPNGDLEEDIQQDYLEAARILERSPRGAAALLRLAIQKLCQQLGQPGKNVNADIAALVRNGEIPQRVQQALDIVRVVGNNAVHPGQIDLRDDRETALRLFQLVNIIADRTISQPKQVDELYEALPEPARKQIEERDGTGSTT